MLVKYKYYYFLFILFIGYPLLSQDLIGVFEGDNSGYLIDNDILVFEHDILIESEGIEIVAFQQWDGSNWNKVNSLESKEEYIGSYIADLKVSDNGEFVALNLGSSFDFSDVVILHYTDHVWEEVMIFEDVLYCGSLEQCFNFEFFDNGKSILVTFCEGQIMNNYCHLKFETYEFNSQTNSFQETFSFVTKNTVHKRHYSNYFENDSIIFLGSTRGPATYFKEQDQFLLSEETFHHEEDFYIDLSVGAMSKNTGDLVLSTEFKDSLTKVRLYSKGEQLDWIEKGIYRSTDINCGVYDMDITNNGQYVVVGFIRCQENNESYIDFLEIQNDSFFLLKRFEFIDPLSGNLTTYAGVSVELNADGTLLMLNTGNNEIHVYDTSDIVSSTNQITAQNFTIYPNPTNGNIEIVLPADLSCDNYMIHDMNGRLIVDGDYTSILDLQTLTTGIYNLSILCDDSMLKQRFIKF